MRRMPSSLPTASGSRASEIFYAQRASKTELGRWANFKKYLWNKEKETYCNRTIVGWEKILTFYLTFLFIVFGLFFLMLFGWNHFIKKTGNPWVIKKDLVKDASPGVGFIPNIANSSSPLIWYTTVGKEEDNNLKPETYIRYLKRYFETYQTAAKNPEKYSNCSQEKQFGKPCMFLLENLGFCARDDFGYTAKTPCFYIKINKLPDWIPQYYYIEEDLPSNMPEELKKVVIDSEDKKKLWLHCKGINAYDQEHIGRFTYYPYQGFMGYYFPYSGEKDYISPLVAVRAENIHDGYDLNVECSVWSKNMNQDSVISNVVYVHVYLAKDPIKTDASYLLFFII